MSPTLPTNEDLETAREALRRAERALASAKNVARAARGGKNTKDLNAAVRTLTRDLRDAHCHERALFASLGHPLAAWDGDWTILQEDEAASFAGRLEAYLHSGVELYDAGFRNHEISVRAPVPDPAIRKRRVISIDCECIGVYDPRTRKSDVNTLAQVVAVDVLTGDVLLDILVMPSRRVSNFRERHSGLSEGMFAEYDAVGLVVSDVEAARAELFKFIDQRTIITGFALYNDMRMLGFAHSRIVDVQILEKLAVESVCRKQVKRCCGLKNLCQGLLSRKIQENDFGHDCMEDSFSPRELLIWWLDPANAEALRQWALERARNPDVFEESGNEEPLSDGSGEPSDYL